MSELAANIILSLAFGVNIGFYTSNGSAGLAAFLGMYVISSGLHEIARAIVWPKEVSTKIEVKTE